MAQQRNVDQLVVSTAMPVESHESTIRRSFTMGLGDKGYLLCLTVTICISFVLLLIGGILVIVSDLPDAVGIIGLVFVSLTVVIIIIGMILCVIRRKQLLQPPMAPTIIYGQSEQVRYQPQSQPQVATTPSQPYPGTHLTPPWRSEAFIASQHGYKVEDSHLGVFPASYEHQVTPDEWTDDP